MSRATALWSARTESLRRSVSEQDGTRCPIGVQGYDVETVVFVKGDIGAHASEQSHELKRRVGAADHEVITCRVAEPVGQVLHLAVEPGLDPEPIRDWLGGITDSFEIRGVNVSDTGIPKYIGQQLGALPPGRREGRILESSNLSECRTRYTTVPLFPTRPCKAVAPRPDVTSIPKRSSREGSRVDRRLDLISSRAIMLNTVFRNIYADVSTGGGPTRVPVRRRPPRGRDAPRQRNDRGVFWTF